MLREYIDMAQLYGFDGTLKRVVCALDLQGMRKFLATFRMERQDWTRGTEPCARAFTLVTDLMGMDADATAFQWGNAGMGTPWWRDTSASTPVVAFMDREPGQHGAGGEPAPHTKREGRWNRKSKGGEANPSALQPQAATFPPPLHTTGGHGGR